MYICHDEEHLFLFNYITQYYKVNSSRYRVATNNECSIFIELIFVGQIKTLLLHYIKEHYMIVIYLPNAKYIQARITHRNRKYLEKLGGYNS